MGKNYSKISWPTLKSSLILQTFELQGHMVYMHGLSTDVEEACTKKVQFSLVIPPHPRIKTQQTPKPEAQLNHL